MGIAKVLGLAPPIQAGSHTIEDRGAPLQDLQKRSLQASFHQG